MTQTLKTLINTVAAEVYELQDTKADRIELNAYVRTVNPETLGVDSSGNPVPQLVSLVKTGSVLSINTQNLRAVLAQIIPDPDICNIDLSNFSNNVVTDKRPLPVPEHHLRGTGPARGLLRTLEPHQH